MEDYNHDETLLARWLSDELTEDELADLQLREDYADLQAIVEGMKGLEAPAFSEQAAWEKLQQRLKAEPPKSAGTLPPTAAISEREKEIAEAIATAVAAIPTTTVISEGKLTEAKTVTHEVAAISASPTTASQPKTPTVAPKLTSTVETPIRTVNRRQWLYAAAAAVALLIATFLWLRDTDPIIWQATVIATKAGEQKQSELPDGSTANLNALSTLAFTDSDWSDEREVYLKGEAYFKAKKGKTFTVLTGQGSVKVVGTMFNVYARENTLEVKCTEGTVQVLSPTGSEKALIKKGEQVSVVNGRMQRRAGIDFTPKWFNGESVFRSAPRSRVFGEIERQFGVTVIGDGLEEKPFSGKFVNGDLDKALKMISVPMGLKYEIRNDTVWFSPK